MSKDYFKAKYESLGEALLASQSTAPPQWTDRASRRNGDSKWSGTNSFESAITLAKDGWPMGRAKMAQAVSSAVSASYYNNTPAMHLDVAGAYPVAAIAAAGDAFCMVSPAPVSDRARPIVRLLISSANSQAVRAERIFNYGAALLSIIDGLEQADYRVELALAYAGEKNSHKNFFEIVIKQAQEILDLDRMAFCLSNASMFRRIVFSLYELNLPSYYEGGYGTPRIPERGKDFEESQILLPSAQSFDSLDSPQEAVKAIAPTIQKLLIDRFSDFPPIIFDRAA